MRWNLCLAAGLAAALGAQASGQVVINEVYENPPGGGSTNDAFAEFIELYGPPGMDLTGYAIALFKGGEDSNGDNIPGGELPEIDEAFSLDGLSLGANGFLVLYNGSPNQSFIPLLLPNEGETAVSFLDQHIDTPLDPEGVGNLNNDGSSTYLLIRRRVDHSIVDGVSVYGPNYAMWKDVDPDTNFDGRIDFGVELPLPGAQDPARMVDPLQIIDEFAWSNGGGKEYVRDSEFEISETDGFNPDAVSRLSYFGQNPMLGLRMNSEGATVPTRIADEEFIYGDMTGSSIDMTYNPMRAGAPTDPNGDGFQDIAIESGGELFTLTPGTFNDHAPTGITQFRFVAGDLNFDQVVDAADLALLDAELLGADFDATEDFIDPDTGLPVPDPINMGQNLQSYVFQGRLANGFLAAQNLDPADGPMGENAATVTAADRAVLAALVGDVSCDADWNGDESVNIFDILAYLDDWNAMLPDADINDSGAIDIFDILEFLATWNDGCP